MGKTTCVVNQENRQGSKFQEIYESVTDTREIIRIKPSIMTMLFQTAV